MAESKAVEAIGFMKERLRETGLNIDKIILFGSQTKGEATEDSDIDIIVISKDFHNKDIFKRARLTKEAEISTIRKFMIPFDILTMTPEEFESENSLLSDYARKGEIVYATQMERGDYASAPQVRAYDEVFGDLPSTLTIKESSEYLDVAEVTVRRWAKEGKLPFHKVGKNYVFAVDDLRKWKRRTPHK